MGDVGDTVLEEPDPSPCDHVIVPEHPLADKVTLCPEVILVEVADNDGAEGAVHPWQLTVLGEPDSTYEQPVARIDMLLFWPFLSAAGVGITNPWYPFPLPASKRSWRKFPAGILPAISVLPS